jgi:hypothetical protein
MAKGWRIISTCSRPGENVLHIKCIMNSLPKHISDARPKGSPTDYTFGNSGDLFKTPGDSGLFNTSIKNHTLYHKAGTFGQHWIDYTSSTANSIRSPSQGSKGNGTAFSIKKTQKRRRINIKTVKE